MSFINFKRAWNTAKPEWLLSEIRRGTFDEGLQMMPFSNLWPRVVEAYRLDDTEYYGPDDQGRIKDAFLQRGLQIKAQPAPSAVPEWNNRSRDGYPMTNGAARRFVSFVRFAMDDNEISNRIHDLMIHKQIPYAKAYQQITGKDFVPQQGQQTLDAAQKLLAECEKLKAQPDIDEGKILFFEAALKNAVNDYTRHGKPLVELQNIVEWVERIMAQDQEANPPQEKEHDYYEDQAFRRENHPRPPEETL